MAKTGSQHITSGAISRESPTDVLRVVTKILRTEIQVRFYGGNDLMYGKIRPLSDDKKRELFNIFNKCLDDRDRDDYAPEAPGGRRQFKICAKGSCMRTVSGTAEPLHGREISKLISEIIGEENLYFYGQK